METNPYLIQGEIINYHKFSDKNVFYSLLNSTCHHINKKYKKDILIPFQINSDSKLISGLFSNIKNIYSIIDEIEDNIAPQKAIFALSQGQLHSYGNSMDLNLMSGEIFDISENILERLKNTNLFFAIQTDSSYDSCLRWQINFILNIKMKWSPKKREIIKKYLQTRNQNKVAVVVGISQQAISKNLSNSMLNEINFAEKDLHEILRLYPETKGFKPVIDNINLNKWFEN